MLPIKVYLGAVAVTATMMTAPALAGDTRNDDFKRIAAVHAAISACLSDRAELCPDVTPGKGRILACLVAQADQLSPSCAGAMETASDALMSARWATRPGPLVKTSLAR
jgi:hypothetical protein